MLAGLGFGVYESGWSWSWLDRVQWVLNLDRMRLSRGLSASAIRADCYFLVTTLCNLPWHSWLSWSSGSISSSASCSWLLCLRSIRTEKRVYMKLNIGLRVSIAIFKDPGVKHVSNLRNLAWRVHDGHLIEYAHRPFVRLANVCESLVY